MQPIADWLEKLGLSEYAQPFADNDIDFTILRDLTDQDLEKIGIASLGHRRKILRAIANLEPIENRPPACAVEAPAVPLPLESCRAPPSHGDVLRPGGFDGALCPHGPGGPARGHFGLSQMRRRDRAPFRRVRGAILGRRRARLFWLSAGPRGRRRAGGTGGAGTDRGSGRTQDACVAANPCWHCHRSGCGWRPDRIRRPRRSVASSARRQILPRACKELRSRTCAGYCREHTKTSRQSL